MDSTIYIDPWRGQIRALEHNIVKYRAMQMTLAIYYAEEIRRVIISAIQTHDKFFKSLKPAETIERLPPGTKKPLEKAIKIWIDEKLISEKEAEDIKRLVDYRNDIAHRMHLLHADLSKYRWVKDRQKYGPQDKVQYDSDAAVEMEALLCLLNDRLRAASRILTLNPNALLFDAAEKSLKQELKSLRLKIDNLFREREREIAAINAELKSIHSTFRGEAAPNHWHQKYDNGRLTPRGVEVCYRLFDEAYSLVTVAYAMGLSLRSATKRQEMWREAGGKKRVKSQLAELPTRKFHQRYDD
nr:hypothetical protein [uncultured Hyphomonas sp.]